MSEDVLRRYPGVAEHPLAMALMCAPLIDRGCHDDAYTMGAAALALAPEDAAVREIVRRTLSASVPAFHLDMLHDTMRNACYAAAIARLVTPGMRVLEIGTGAGLLAMLAARAGAEVVTCESNPMIAAAARDVVARNGLCDRIRIVPKRSSDLRIGVDVPERCDLLVSEIFGDDLVEEGVVAALTDARARLLHPDAGIIPPRARLRCALVADDRPRNPPLAMVEGFDLSSFAPLAHARRYVPHRPSKDVTLRSAPVPALAIDFTGPPVDTLRGFLTMISDGGRVDGIAHWLQLDFGAGVLYENAPLTGAATHWMVPIHFFPAPVDTHPGQEIAAEVRAFGPRLVINRSA